MSSDSRICALNLDLDMQRVSGVTNMDAVLEIAYGRRACVHDACAGEYGSNAVSTESPD
jgi:hypothetical protein